ncbi:MULTISPECIES: alpha/beta fold hydrolase [Gulbenkiania]|uniref:Alpha/beta hydrolase family n=2 Tax=Gulbenkiania TaxID=397456 RepID=A0A0K6H6J5_9NEIS|nr:MULTISPECIES: alpha/beta hydrolase [Gulbenkiania]TCW33716.1 alpha/beta hydrolase family protein [Gulbenkiania mobilis]CUA86590.1 Alpha/beta hydrolase family [Gulbenkiania indica]
MPLAQSDLHVPVGSHTLYLKRLHLEGRPDGAAVLMVHGVMANGRTFYSPSGKGLAPFLAEAGYDVFVADLRGRGLSRPKIGPGDRHGQTETIVEDLPALQAAIRRLKDGQPVHWVAHSWGGVHMSSCLVRFPELIPQVRSLVYFGSKRSVHARNLSKLIEVDFMWNIAARVLIRAFGYLPARRIGLGADDETDKSHLQSREWAKVQPWVDSHDGFDYGAAARSVTLPPALYLAARNDPCRGHPEDVRRFRDESGPHLSRLHLLARATGHRHDYNHVSLLTHPEAPQDHFPLVLHWLAGRYDSVPENY